MADVLATLLDVKTCDEDIRRRGRNTIAIALGLIALSLAFVPSSLRQGQLVNLLSTLVSVTLLAWVVLLARRGHVSLAGTALTGITIIVLFAVLLANRTLNETLFFTPISILAAGLVLRPRAVWSVGAINLAGIALVGAILGQLPPPTVEVSRQISSAAAMVAVTSLLAYLGARSTRVALDAAQHARAQAEASAGALEQANAALEARVVERTAELAAALETQRAQAAELEASLAAQQALNQTIAALSLPVIPVRHDVLVAPLVGNIGAGRADQLLGIVVNQVATCRARAMILDVTGVAVVDTQVAQALVRTADAVRLLGAQTVLVGIRPEVAQTLVGLGADLGCLRTAATLQEGLAAVTRN
jgi:rsbT co-antagonist protein RsbR